ncbi:GNAT family N-acetyltransferase [Fictibacillus terranigra]|uniref:GNAT family N-acetyltransferase n=1 Tax=Fictibacillus terranigra TaxID=3058424 RepID=A0ABT8E6W3_9BACL|nr:GNAT family N-acetyltransferase [Fictibacillus sp. CENA-BCM004]MDN4073648.1 GNAT family N-acetyltransferase [Fictibacillus sp. CENA-BCM004]
MEVKVSSTNDPSYKDALFVRKQVFVKEQNVSEQEEIDAHEDRSAHFVLYDHGKPIGAGRLRPIESGGKIERVCILASHRKQGLGELLMNKMEEEAKQSKYPSVTLYAQVHAEDFYKKLGYTTTSTEPFLDAGIWHVAMQKALN